MYGAGYPVAVGLAAVLVLCLCERWALDQVLVRKPVLPPVPVG